MPKGQLPPPKARLPHGPANREVRGGGSQRCPKPTPPLISSNLKLLSVKDPEKKPSVTFQAGFPLCLQRNASTTQLDESEHRLLTGSSFCPVTKREPEAHPAHSMCAQSSLSQRSGPGLAPCDRDIQLVMSLTSPVRSYGIFPLKEPLWKVPFVKGTG